MSINRRWILYALIVGVFFTALIGGYTTMSLLVDSEDVSVTFEVLRPIATFELLPLGKVGVDRFRQGSMR